MQEERSTRGQSGRKKTAGARGRKASPKSQAPSQEEIARRAYEIYVRRGGGPGHEAEDWLQAESELREGRGKA